MVEVERAEIEMPGRRIRKDLHPVANGLACQRSIDASCTSPLHVLGPQSTQLLIGMRGSACVPARRVPAVTCVPASRDALRDETRHSYIVMSPFAFLLYIFTSSKSWWKSKLATSASACTVL